MIEFTEGQKRTIANGLTLFSLALVVAFSGFVAWAVLKAVTYVATAIIPVVLGFFLALFFKPYYHWWRRIVRNPTCALVVMLFTVLVPLGVVIWYAGAVVVGQVSNLIAQSPGLVRQVLDWVQATFPRAHELLVQFGFSPAQAGALFAKYEVAAMKAGGGALSFLSGAVSALVTLIFFCFFLMTKERRGQEIVSHMPFLKESTRGFVAAQIDSFIDILVSFFQRQIVICLIEGVMYGAGFWLVGLPYGFLIGFALGVVNLVPFLGSLLCLPVALPLAYFGSGGSLNRLLMVLGVWLLGQFMDGYFITPKIQGDKTGLGYAGVIFSFFFWGTVLGPLVGMLLAIPLSAFCVVLWRALKASYIRPLV